MRNLRIIIHRWIPYQNCYRNFFVVVSEDVESAYANCYFTLVNLCDNWKQKVNVESWRHLKDSSENSMPIYVYIVESVTVVCLCVCVYYCKYKSLLQNNFCLRFAFTRCSFTSIVEDLVEYVVEKC